MLAAGVTRSAARARVPRFCSKARRDNQTNQQRCCAAREGRESSVAALPVQLCVLSSLVLAGLPAVAGDVDFGQGGNADPKSYWTVLILFLISVPGLYSQVKRAPKAKIKRKTFECPGPAADETSTMDSRARQLFRYMKNYNYEVKGQGEVITFVGNYRSSRGQAAAITFYMFMGMLSCGLVFSIALPGGNWWYLMTLLTPLAPWYYYQNADRQEEFSIKMMVADDDKTIDIVVQGDEEEIARMTKELALQEKGMVYVPGILEGAGKASGSDS